MADMAGRLRGNLRRAVRVFGGDGLGDSSN
jgi:hypothetical protein